MEYLTLSVAYTGLKAVSAVVSNFQKLKKLSDLPTEIQEDTFYLIHTVESIKPALELAILLHSRQITCLHVSSSISLARKVLVECESFIESIKFIKDYESSLSSNDDDYESDDNDQEQEEQDDDDDDDEENEQQKEQNRQEIIEYLSAPSQRDRLALLLRRLQLVLQALNLGITSASFIFPKQITIYQFPFKFDYDAFQIALELIRKMEMNRKFNTINKRELWVLTGNLHGFIIPSTKKRHDNKRCEDSMLTRLCHTKCVLSLQQKRRKLDGKSVFAAFMTLYNIEQTDINDDENGDNDDNQDNEDNQDEKNEIDFMNKKCYKMELDFLEFEKFRRFDPIYTKNLNENADIVYDEERDEDIRNIALCYQWVFKKHKFVLEFESLDKFHLKNVSLPISSEVFEFLIALLIIRSTYLESNSKKKNVINNPSIMDQFVSTKDLIKLSKKYLRFESNKQCKTLTPNKNHDVDDLVQSLSDKFSIK